MTLKHPRTVRIERDPELHRAVEDVAADVAADGVPRIVVRDGATLAVVVSKGDFEAMNGAAKEDIWKDYDPEKVREALKASAGAFAGIDTEQLKRDLRDARGQDSTGRPA